MFKGHPGGFSWIGGENVWIMGGNGNTGDSGEKEKGQGRKNENEILLECHNQSGSFLVGITLFFFCIWRYNPPT